MLNMILVQLLNGIGTGMIYFLFAVGLSIVFGIMHFLNLAHGALYMLGAYWPGRLLSGPDLSGSACWAPRWYLASAATP